MPPGFGNPAHALRTQSMAGLAGILDRIDPIFLRFYFRRDAVPVRAGPGEQTFIGDLQHRIPIGAWIIFGGCSGRWRRHRIQVEMLAGSELYFLRIDETVSTHPNVVVRLRKFRDEIKLTL